MKRKIATFPLSHGVERWAPDVPLGSTTLFFPAAGINPAHPAFTVMQARLHRPDVSDLSHAAFFS
jgi:hypothetical protein